MPPRGGRSRSYGRFGSRRPARDSHASAQIKFERRAVTRPASSVQLIAAAHAGGGTERYELICRDGWEWRQLSPGMVAVRVATLDADQAQIVEEWLQRLRDPAFWWATSHELTSPGSSSEVGDALARTPWLAQVLPVVLEASTDGAPPPPPSS